MKPSRDLKRITVIGASAGGLEALKALFAGLDDGLPTAFFVVRHTSPDTPPLLDAILGRETRLPVRYAEDGASIEPGHVYLGVADRHLLVQPGEMRVVHGPLMNRTRPAIDALFRSAAVAYDAATIGILLSGMLDDGAAGLEAIKRCGGLAIVQDPADAAYPDMPQSAIDAVNIDYRLPAAQIGPLINRLVTEPPPHPADVPFEVQIEAEMTERAMSTLEELEKIAEPATLSCPDCGGRLWRVNDALLDRYRCEVGHAYSAGALLNGQKSALEQSLWVALRTMEEQVRMLRRLAEQENSNERRRASRSYLQRAGETAEHADRIRLLLAEMARS